MSEIPQGPERECRRARDSMAQYADSDLAPEQAEWLAGHLETCSDCRHAVTDFTVIDRELIALGRSLDSRNKLPHARERFVAKLEDPLRRRLIGWVSTAAAVAAALVLVAVTPHPKPPGVNRPMPRFATIPYLPPLDPRENATVVRMNIRVATLIAAGYRVTADPAAVVPADVLVGEDGRVHAVRLLQGLDWNGRGE
ncbi:MAG TPA: zf-HC2 domain-containing protein [Bryobacteraceae bacterium]|nr:zf-HC2 domain-containing protein [Bryobacteraceae bacterium]